MLGIISSKWVVLGVSNYYWGSRRSKKVAAWNAWLFCCSHGNQRGTQAGRRITGASIDVTRWGRAHIGSVSAGGIVDINRDAPMPAVCRHAWLARLALHLRRPAIRGTHGHVQARLCCGNAVKVCLTLTCHAHRDLETSKCVPGVRGLYLSL